MPKLLALTLCALLALSAVAEAKPRKDCRRGTISLQEGGAKPLCVKPTRLSAGLPKKGPGRLERIFALSRTAEIWTPQTQQGFDAVMGEDAAAIRAWEDAVYASALRRFGPRPRSARIQAAASGSDDFGISVDGPIRWVNEANARKTQVEQALAGAKTDTQVEGHLTAMDTPKEYGIKIDETEVHGEVCPTVRGTVVGTGSYVITRTVTPAGGAPVREKMIMNYRVTGHIGEDAKLKDYDLDVQVKALDNDGNIWTSDSHVKGIKPGATANEVKFVEGYPTRIRIQRPDNGRSAAENAHAQAALEKVTWAALQHANAEGNRFLHEAQNTWYDASSCITVSWKPADLSGLKPGEVKVVRVKLESAVDGKAVKQELKAAGKGGAKVTPGKTKNGSTAKLKITAPKSRRERVIARVVPARATGAAVEVTGVSRRGRSLGRIDLGTKESEYRVVSATSSYDFEYDDGCLSIRDHVDYTLADGAEPFPGGDFMAALVPMNRNYTTRSTDCRNREDARECNHSGTFDRPAVLTFTIDHLNTSSATADVNFDPWNRPQACSVGVNDPHFDQPDVRWTTQVPWSTVQRDAPFTLEATKTYSAPGQGSGTHRVSVTLQRIR